MKSRLVLALLLVLALPAEARDEPVERSYRMRVSVDAAGKVTQAEPHGDIPALLLPTLQAVATSAEFEPATVNGIAKPSRTSVYISVQLTPKGDQMEARVTGMNAGGGVLNSVPPAYPAGAFREKYSAYIWTRVSYDEQGRLDPDRSGVESVQFTRGPGTRINQRLAADLEPKFRKAVEDAMARWTFLPDEVDGRSMPATVFVPTTFCVVKRGASCSTLWTDDMLTPPATPTAQDDTIRLAVMRPQSLPAAGG
ncbi:hypothetical protein [Arenimonas sp. MALMAid1274]|uniref:hypothetical protein n=1 Tax=Arenimonas sp. MALMAid1274 TaxID=3411630 RepID=UPI003B9F6A51